MKTPKVLSVLLFAAIFGLTTKAQNTFIYPDDTLVNPSFFESNNLLEDWEMGFCPVSVNGNNDTVFAPCYTVTFMDHYTASIELCPADTTEVGGIGLFNGDPRLLDASLWADMELDGSNIISNQDNKSVNYKNLTTGQEVDGGGPNPKYCIEADLYEGENEVWYQRFQILLGPIQKPGPAINYHTAETIGILKNGMVLEHTPPSSESTAAIMGGMIPLDWCGFHPEPAGFGHFHTIPYGINVSLAAGGIASSYHCTDMSQLNNTGLAGFTFEGIPIYAPYDNGQSNPPNDLDNCNGHTSATPDFPNGVYHYHASATDIINNPPCRDFYAPLEDTRFEYGEWTGQLPDTTDTGSTDTTVHIGRPMASSSLIKVYPNPATDELFVDGTFDRLDVFDAQGKLMFSADPNGIDNRLRIVFREWEKGIYFISAELNDQFFFDKVLIQ